MRKPGVMTLAMILGRGGLGLLRRINYYSYYNTTEGVIKTGITLRPKDYNTVDLVVGL